MNSPRRGALAAIIVLATLSAATIKAAAPLDFLADIPALKTVHLGMTEPELLAVLKSQALRYERNTGNGEVSYHVRAKNDATVYFGFREGHCTGIQRLPGE